MSDLVLIVVFDGLRPDQVTPANSPNLHALSRRGVNFTNHHATFPTQTRVNVASIFTGCYPGRHGIMVNSMYIPDLDPTWKINTGDHLALQELERRSAGHALMAGSLGEALHGAGRMMAAVGVGSTGNTLLHHHKAATPGGIVVHPALTVPASHAEELARRFGPWPEPDMPNEARI